VGGKNYCFPLSGGIYWHKNLLSALFGIFKYQSVECGFFQGLFKKGEGDIFSKNSETNRVFNNNFYTPFLKKKF
jgi:hypothetical protein